MSAALRLVELETHSSSHPTFRPTTGPTLVPSERPTLSPMSAMALRGTEPPTTQRSATLYPRFEAAARHEVHDMLAVMRLNADFLASLLSSEESSSIALYDTLEQLQRGIDSLEQRFTSSAPILPRSR